MTLTLKQQGKSHAEILADGKWIATVRTEDDPARAEVVRLALENAASAKRNETPEE